MRRDGESGISIWWFIGALLSVYGLLILGTGILQEFFPLEKPPVLHELRPTLWWGTLLIVAGAFYTIRFWPWRSNQ